MTPTQNAFIGIDPSAGKSLTWAVLDNNRRLLNLEQGDLEALAAQITAQPAPRLALCGPFRPNQGLMQQPEWRARLQPPPKPGRWLNCRVAEYLLRQRGLHCPLTAAVEADCPAWMPASFAVFRRLQSMGFTAYPQTAGLQVLEIYPPASYLAWLGHPPLPRASLEGRLQRQALLYDERLNIHDPMEFFEEITRHRLRQGVLPVELLYTPSALDALAAAYSAWISLHQPERLTLLGEAEEGQIVI